MKSDWFPLNWTFLPATLRNTSDQFELSCFKPELIDLSQDKQTYRSIYPGLKTIHIVQSRVERLGALMCVFVCFVKVWKPIKEMMIWRKYDHLMWLHSPSDEQKQQRTKGNSIHY